MAGVSLNGPQVLIGAMAKREGFRLWRVCRWTARRSWSVPRQRGKDSGYGGCVAGRPTDLGRCHGKQGRIPAMAGVTLNMRFP